MRKPAVYVIGKPPIRESFSDLLEADGYEVSRYRLPSEFLKAVDPWTKGCVLTGLATLEMSGVEFLMKMKERGFVSPVIFLAEGARVRQAVEAMKAGAADFFEKPEQLTVLASIHRALADGRKSLHLALARHDNESQRRTAGRLASLTPRERDVLAGLLNGAQNKIIAHRLGISVRTVELHRARVMAKMEANSLPELVRMGLRLPAEVDPLTRDRANPSTRPTAVFPVD